MTPHPVVVMPPGAVVLDLTRPWTDPGTPWSIGRYDEDRAIYTQELFAGAPGAARRTVHLGLDLGAPAGVAVHAPVDGVVAHAGALPAPGDYGHALVLRHALAGRPVWVLYGHLSAASLAHSPVGRRVGRGAVLGWLGDEADNGGWPPHVHVQLSWADPGTHDMQGVCTPAERAAARAQHPDPRRLLGPVYA